MRFAVPLLLVLSLAFGGEWRILFDASLNAHLAGCDCPTSPKSGLVKRLAFIEEKRKAHPGNVLLVSTGDLFDLYPDEAEQKRVVAALEIARYDAIALGDQEFVGGKSFLEGTAKRLPLLAANLSVDGWFGDTRFPAMVIREAGGKKVAFVGLSSPVAYKFFQDRKLREKIKIQDPAEAVAALLPTLKGKADFVVLLTHQGLDADRALAKKITGVSLILGGHTQELTTSPLVENGIPIFHAGGNGNWQVEIVLDEAAKVRGASYHFFKYPDGRKPIVKEAILGEAKWTHPVVIHEAPADDPRIARLLEEARGR